MFGFLNLDKPSGPTSRDVVNRVQHLLRPRKVGHAGTLDPLATGVLIVAVGPATRLVPYVQRLPKRYTATFLLGRESDTEDVEGAVRELADPPRPSREAIEAVLPHFVGEIQQVPPAFSAIKLGGARAYELARQGRAVPLAPRPVVVHQIRLADYDYPRLRLDVACGSGTYIRSLGRDLAGRLATGAVMSELRRTAIGPFTVDTALGIDDLTAENLREHLHGPLAALAMLPAISVTDDEARRLLQGQRLDNRFETAADELAVVDSQGELIALARPVDSHRIKVFRGFPRASD